MSKTIVSFPRMGTEYTLQIKKSIESLGIKVMLPPQISNKTKEIGVKHSADMMCFPYKVTLGNIVEMIDSGVNTILMYDSCGQCRLKQYYKLQELALKEMGYKFQIISINFKTIIPVLKRLSGKSTLTVFLAVKDMIKGIKKIDDRKYEWKELNIGICGEVFCCCESTVNYDIEKKLKGLGANPINTANLSEFIYESLKFRKWFKDEKREYKRRAMTYFNGKLGGHGIQNVYNVMYMIDKKIDGIIHLLPLTCMPDVTVETVINKLCRDAKVPLLRFHLDETDSEANMDTRVETFVELIRRRK